MRMTIGQLFQEVFPDIQVTENGTCVWLNETEFPNHFTLDMEWWNTEIPTDIDELQNRATEEKLKAKEAELESVIEALKSDLDETLAVLGEQPEIVRCRDCKYWNKTTREEGNDCILGPWEDAVCDMLRDWDGYGEFGEDFSRTNGDWFCADGERR